MIARLSFALCFASNAIFGAIVMAGGDLRPISGFILLGNTICCAYTAFSVGRTS